MEKVNWKELDIKPHQIALTLTNSYSYEEDRNILLNYDFDNYIVLTGYHCSCYDFEDVEWEAIKYTSEELKKIAKADYNEGDEFWKMVRKYLHIS